MTENKTNVNSIKKKNTKKNCKYTFSHYCNQRLKIRDQKSLPLVLHSLITCISMSLLRFHIPFKQKHTHYYIVIKIEKIAHTQTETARRLNEMRKRFARPVPHFLTFLFGLMSIVWQNNYELL